MEGPLGFTPFPSPSGASTVVFCLLGSGEKQRAWGTTGVQQLLSGESWEPLDVVWLSLSEAGPVLGGPFLRGSEQSCCVDPHRGEAGLGKVLGVALGRLESLGLAGVGKADRRLEALGVLAMPHGAGILWRGVLPAGVCDSCL